MERQVYDFSEAKIRCHAAYYVCTKGKYPTPKEKYEQMVALLESEVSKYHNMTDNAKIGKSGLSKAAKIAGIEQEIEKLEPTKDQDPLPAGAKSYLKRLYGYLKYGKWSASLEKGNKYTDKGKLAEPDAIQLVSMLDGVLYEKNTETFENEFIMGTPDIITTRDEKKHIIDVKASWDWETFAENIGKPLNPLYWWQIQAYLYVKDYEQGEVSYCLVDTPPSILEEEKYKLFRRTNLIQDTPEALIAEATLVNNMTFSDIHPMERRLMFPVARDESAIERIKTVVPKCRDYLFELQEMHLTGYFTDKELPILETIEEI